MEEVISNPEAMHALNDFIPCGKLCNTCYPEHHDTLDTQIVELDDSDIENEEPEEHFAQAFPSETDPETALQKEFVRQVKEEKVDLSKGGLSRAKFSKRFITNTGNLKEFWAKNGAICALLQIPQTNSKGELRRITPLEFARVKEYLRQF